MTRKFWNWVRNEEPDSFGSDRTLYLDGEISDETWFGDEVTPKLFSDELHMQAMENTPSESKLSGGDVLLLRRSTNMLDGDYPHDGSGQIDALALRRHLVYANGPGQGLS